jgi:hypothetical protein
MNKSLCLAAVLVSCSTASGERYYGGGHLGRLAFDISCSFPNSSACGVRYVLPLAWYFDVTIDGNEATFHEIRWSVDVSLLTDYDGKPNTLDLQASISYDPFTVPILLRNPNDPEAGFITDYLLHPPSVRLSGAFQSVPFDGVLPSRDPSYPQRFRIDDLDTTPRIVTTGFHGIVYGDLPFPYSNPFLMSLQYGAFSESLYLISGTPSPGDFNYNGFVDAADYVLARNSPVLYDYNLWRANFGNSSSGPGLSNAVPEPSSLLLILTILTIFLLRSSLREPVLGFTVSA